MIDTALFENKKAAYFTLGCKLNFAETSTIEKQFAAKGIRRAIPGEQADICMINTCSVTELAEKKSRQMIRRVIKRHPGAFIVVTGCYAQLQPEEISRFEGVGLVSLKDNNTFFPSCSQGDRTRHFLKVQDGCDYYCSYCTVPFARGKSRNLSIAGLVSMVEQAASEGAKEIVLTGVNVGDFGKTTDETFFDLLTALDRVQGIERFRISSIEPNLLTDKILEFVAQSQRFAPHFHIPLQSGSDAVLRLMKRKYDTAFFLSKVNKIKQLMTDAFIGVDVIVGVRGETDEFFEETLRFLETLPFSQLHVFTYSERPGTQALEIDYKVNPKTKQMRSRQLLALSEEKRKAFYRSQQGKEKKVLFEHTRKGNKMHGFTENYIRVEAAYTPEWINRPMVVKLGTFNAEQSALLMEE